MSLEKTTSHKYLHILPCFYEIVRPYAENNLLVIASMVYSGCGLPSKMNLRSCKEAEVMLAFLLHFLKCKIITYVVKWEKHRPKLLSCSIHLIMVLEMCKCFSGFLCVCECVYDSVCAWMHRQPCIMHTRLIYWWQSFSYDGGGTEMHVGLPPLLPLLHVTSLLWTETRAK